MEQGSEVARLLRQIGLEYEAAQRALNSFAYGASKHKFINARVENIGKCHEQLKGLVGEGEAIKVVAQVLEHAGNEDEAKQ